MQETSVLGKSYSRVDAADKVTGKSQYTDDVHLPGMLHCKIHKSSRRHARILSIDTSRAEWLAGVRAVITARDFPDVRFGSAALRDRRLLALEKVRYIGEPIAAVAAVDEITAKEAVDLIDVEYEDLPHVVHVLEALKPGAPLIHEDLPDYEGYSFAMEGNICTILDNDRGDAEVAFQESDYIFEDTFRSQGVNQGFLEPMACVATVDPSGRINVWDSTQGPYLVRAELAALLDLPLARIRVIPMELGGGFGVKQHLCLEAYPVMLAQKTGKPVKITATREEVFTVSGPRLPATIYLKTGVMKDGTIVARDMVAVFDVGAYLGPGPAAGIGHGLGAYHIPNFRIRSYAVYTNKIWTGSYRASGAADMTFAVESHVDIIAHKMGLDPFEFRLKNAYVEGDTSVRGDRISRNGLKETLRAVQERLGPPGTSADNETRAARGVGLALCEWRSGSGPSTASVSPNPPMDRDGRRKDSGRGEGVTGAMIRARIWVDGRLAGGLQALLGAPMAAYSGCGERDGGIGHGKRRSRTGLARVCGDVGLAGGSVADGRRQAGSGMARSRARARLNCSSQGQRRGRCRVNRRAERVIRPAKAKTRRLRVLVVTIC